MSKLVACTALAILGVLQAYGQEGVLPPPKAPFLKNLPAACTWKIAFQKDGKPLTADSAPAASNMISLRQMVEIQGTKRPEGCREILLWSNGATSETWSHENFILSTSPGSEDVTVSEIGINYAGMQPFTPGFGQKDFPDLQWISPDSYQGTEEFQGRPCYVYKQPVSGNSTPIIAYIDGQSLWPVALRQGPILRVYSINTTPPAPFTLPVSLVKELERYKRSLAVTTRHTMP